MRSRGSLSAHLIARYRKGRTMKITVIGRPIVFRAGSSTVLAAVQIEGRRLIIELAHIDGGGEGVLPTLWRFVRASGAVRRDRVASARPDARGPTHGFRHCSKRWGSSSRIFPSEYASIAG